MNKDFHRWVYVCLGDGEQNEGNVWEAAMLAAKYNLTMLLALSTAIIFRLTALLNRLCHLKICGAKWEAFGWHVIDINGNDVDAVIDACAMARAIVEKPVMILAHTIPGKGVDFMECDFHWHGMPVGLADVAGAPPNTNKQRLPYTNYVHWTARYGASMSKYVSCRYC